MTKDYALFLLNQLCIGASVEAMPIITQPELSQALSVAIKALEQDPCEDAVSRQAVDEYITNLLSGYLYDEERTRLEDLTAYIWELPSVTPQPKIGQWIAGVDRWGDIVTTVNGYRCSECCAFNADKDNYCPNCGARMIESEKGNICDNDCEHCDWVTCPKMEQAESEDKE